MRMHRALLLAAVIALSTLDGVAEEKQIVDVKELAGKKRRPTVSRSSADSIFKPPSYGIARDGRHP